MKLKTLFILIWMLNALNAQDDTIQYQWPVTPLNSSHGLNATFCEFRNTLSSDHFHNAVDIGKADGEPCFPVMDGEVYAIGNSGSNSYVRIATHIDDQWKHLTYLHIEPNPSLSVGDNVVAGSTILGTIYTGMGHVHLTERELVAGKNDFAAEINNIRQSGGLIPYNDPYPPLIQRNSLKFYLDDSKIEVPAFGLSGNIDIQVKITEHNGSGDVQTNNGTYIAGYRVWSQDTSQIVFEPNDSGVKYRFDRKPSNSYVHLVFAKEIATLSNPVYWLTNGAGADEINQSQVVSNNYFNASVLDSGDYVLEIFTEDTRGNKDIEFFDIVVTDQDVTAPARPEIYSIENSDNAQSLEIQIKSNSEKDLLGYRLYYSADNQLADWQLAADEFLLTKNNLSLFLQTADSFIVSPAQDVYFFRLSAVDSSGNESDPGDVYARSVHVNGNGRDKALIVNGFTRHTGSASWQSPTHSFVKSYFDPLITIDSLVISSCSNQAIIDNKISLADYDIVIWFLGDESTVDHTFTSSEQAKVKSYLENGGKLFVSGAEIGWDLGRSHNGSEAGDQDFYNNYLKASYVFDGTGDMSAARGISASLFNNVLLNFGQVYPEDYPDDIDPVNGSQLIMEYNATRSPSIYRGAAIAYSGTFGESIEQGQLVYLAFPFETVSSLEQRQNFIISLLSYFSVITSIKEPFTKSPESFSISQNYPNPFNSSTQFALTLPVKKRVIVKIFDMLGQEVQQIVNDVLPQGEHTFSWDADKFASGLYLIKMQAGDFSQARKIILIK